MPDHTMEYYRKQKAKGLCVRCGRPAKRGRTKCEYHIQQMNGFAKTTCDKRRMEGRCIGCGWPLHEEMDEGHVKCIQCRMDARRMRIPNENTRMVCSKQL